MTDEENAEEYVKQQILKHNRDVVLRPKNAITYIDELKQAHLDGIAKGRKEEDEKLFNNWCKGETPEPQECLFLHKLEKENEQLKKQEEILLDRILSLQKTNGSLTDKVEKMKCCGNCKKRPSCIKYNNFVYPEMTNPINYGCIDLSKWELAE